TAGDSASVAVHVTVTSDVYQPFKPSVPMMDGAEITGGVLSTAGGVTTGGVTTGGVTTGTSTVNATSAENPLSLFEAVVLARTFTVWLPFGTLTYTTLVAVVWGVVPAELTTMYSFAFGTAGHEMVTVLPTTTTEGTGVARLVIWDGGVPWPTL
ncbi:MAG: hypothetical protein ABIV11_06735, partial [Gemmatimonadaceae bacterium]